MIRHQITGARLRSRHFGGAEAKSRHLPTLRCSRQAVKSTCRTVRGCEEMIYISSQPFLCRYFLQMTAGAPPPLSSRAELPVVIRRNGSGFYEDSEPGDLPLPWSLLTSEWDFSTLQRFRGNDKKTGRAAVSIGSLSMKDGASAF